jgi:hypothetical protein
MRDSNYLISKYNNKTTKILNISCKIMGSFITHIHRYVVAFILTILSLSSFAGAAEDELANMVAAKWMILFRITDEPATTVLIDSKTVNRDDYPIVRFTVLYELTGPESINGLPTLEGKYNHKMVRLVFDCDNMESTTEKSVYWFINNSTERFIARDWGDGTSYPIKSNSVFRKVISNICHP